MTSTESTTGTPKLRRELKVWAALALSIGLMSPALAMSASGAGAAALVGQNVPLAFLGAGVVIALVAYGFVFLSRHFAHAGSVYGFTGVTLGPRAGFTSGWALLACYATFIPSALFAFGAFAAQFCQSTGLWPHASYLPFTLAAVVLVWFFTGRDVRKLTRGLLAIEGLSVILIITLMVVVVVKLGIGAAPAGQQLTAGVFVPSSSLTVHGLSLGIVFGFLAFAGFEGAASLGEEALNPRRSIPRALIVAVAFAVVFYVLCMTVQTWAFGADAKGASAFASSGGPLFQIASTYVSNWLAAALELGAAISALGAGLATATGGARLLFALARDGAPKSRLTKLSSRTGAPVYALGMLMVIALLCIVGVAVTGAGGLDAWGYLGTIGVLALLVAYILVNVGAARYIWTDKTGRRWRAIIPILAVAALAFILYNQVYPVPPAPFNVFPYIVAAWLVIGVLIVMLAPGVAVRVGRGLAQEDGLAIEDTPVPAKR